MEVCEKTVVLDKGVSYEKDMIGKQFRTRERCCGRADHKILLWMSGDEARVRGGRRRVYYVSL